VAEAKEIDDMSTKVIMILLNCGHWNPSLPASEVRRTIPKEKDAWLKKRMDEGYSSEMDALWTIGSSL